jgi:hypothetical protein|tara:strand:- start:2199 stop:3002 length:804 start_codon:yes stop_codon:yes gene_type:complete
MPIQDTIVAAQEEFTQSYELAVNEFVDNAKELEENNDSNQVILALGALAVADYWLQDLAIESAINQYMLRIDSVLDDLRFFGNIDESRLRAFRLANENLIRNYSVSLGDKVKLSVIRGISAGQDASAIKNLVLRDYFLRSSSISTFVQTQIADYANLVTQSLAETAPENTKYIFINPIDSKTRHVCTKMVSFGPMTRKEVEANFPGAFADRGGPNCRGYWDVATNEDKELVSDAKKEFSDLKRRYKEKGRSLSIKTQKQYYDKRKNG